MKTLALLMFALFLFGLFSGLTLKPVDAVTTRFDEYQITSDNAAQQFPDIYGTTIVYQDNRNGDWDIYMFSLYGTLTPETRITDNSADQINPQIYGDIIVWQDDRNGNWDIYIYNITAHTETQITNNTSTQGNPAIDGNRIVWQDNRNGNGQIYMYDLTTQTESRLTASSPNVNPAISGNRVVYKRTIWGQTWDGRDTVDQQIFCYDISVANENQLFTTNNGYIFSEDVDFPAIYGSQIVFMTKTEHLTYPPGWLFPQHSWEWNVNLRGTTSWDTTVSLANQQYPDIYDNYIVYQDDRNGNWEIYLYNTESGIESRVTNSTASQLYPTVFGGRIVYADYRNGNWDIYVTMVSYAPDTVSPPPGGGPTTGSPPGSGAPTAEDAIGQVQSIKSIVADPSKIPASDIDGANNKVKENRREALLNKLDAAVASVQAADYQSAIDQLNSILDKTDGCSLRGRHDEIGSGYTPDWITNLTAQETIYPQINSCLITLQTLFDNIS